jgi:hypothetical protein
MARTLPASGNAFSKNACGSSNSMIESVIRTLTASSTLGSDARLSTRDTKRSVSITFRLAQIPTVDTSRVITPRIASAVTSQRRPRLLSAPIGTSSSVLMIRLCSNPT